MLNFTLGWVTYFRVTNATIVELSHCAYGQQQAPAHIGQSIRFYFFATFSLL